MNYLNAVRLLGAVLLSLPIATDAQCVSESPWPLTLDDATATVTCVSLDSTVYESGDATRLCTAGTWQSVDSASCVKSTCSADSGFSQTDSGDTATLACATYDNTHYASGDASRACSDSTWAAVDESACVLAAGVYRCDAETVWFSTWGSETRTLACHLADGEIYVNDGGNATRDCSAVGVWGTPDVASCTLKTCSADGGWVETDVQGTATLDCGTHDAALYQAGEDATRVCENAAGTPTWSGTVTTSSCVYNDCTDGTWGTTNHGATATIDCNTLDAALYKAGEDASRVCAATVYGDIDPAACVYNDCAEDTVNGVIYPITVDGATATISNSCATHDSVHYDAGDLSRVCAATVWGAVDDSACELADGVTACEAYGAWPRGFGGETTTINCSELGYASGTASRSCTGTSWGLIDNDSCVGGPDFTLPDADLSEAHEQYPNRYYINMAEVNADRNIHLGYLKCPGEKVCPKNWIGNGICDDCFGCDRVMVSVGMIGDCSTCAYFWSGGAIDVGTFDGGDCEEFVFPSAFVEAYFDQCLEGADFVEASELPNISFNNKRNTLINKLADGGWGTVEELQDVPNMELAARCQYANLEQCLKKNGWWYASMASWEEGDLKFEVASNADSETQWQSVELVHMENKELLAQCVSAGLHQRILTRGWSASNALSAMTDDDKRNQAIVRLNNAGSGTIAQLQTLSDAALLMLVDYLETGNDVDCVGAWATCAVDCNDVAYTVSTPQAGAGFHCEFADGATKACSSGDGNCA